MRYGIEDMIAVFLLGIVLGACTVALVVIDGRTTGQETPFVNAAERTLTGAQTKSVRLTVADVRLLRSTLMRTCAIRQYEDLSATWERSDDERAYCAEAIGQFGR